MKVVSIVGTRPQFIKHWVLSRELVRRGHEVVLVHTGQHYDKNMSEVFFKDLDISIPDFNLSVGSGSHGMQTGKALMRLDGVLSGMDCDMVVVFGDCNSTLSGALSARKLNMMVCHVEAGLRCGNWFMPEEVNRVLTDHCSDVLCCSTEAASSNLRSEGLSGVFTGDLRVDAVKIVSPRVHSSNGYGFVLATVHRVENTSPNRFKEIFDRLVHLDCSVVFPMHPRTWNVWKGLGIEADNIRVVPPVGYLEMIGLLKGCNRVMTDSGGLMVESYVLGKPCEVIRSVTEYPDVCFDGHDDGMFGCGDAAQRIVSCLEDNVLKDTKKRG